MKRLLLSAIIMFFFSAAIFLTQMSCKKEAKATSVIVPIPTTLYTKDVRGQSSEIWLITNNDITKQEQIKVTLPDGLLIAPLVRLAKDGSGIVFATMNADEKATGIYTCKRDGSGLKKIADAPTGTNSGITLQGVY